VEQVKATAAIAAAGMTSRMKRTEETQVTVEAGRLRFVKSAL
jgi:hypothetical protein